MSYGKISNNLIYHLKESKKEAKMQSKVSRRKELIKMREEINKTETKIRKSNETKSWFFEKETKLMNR